MNTCNGQSVNLIIKKRMQSYLIFSCYRPFFLLKKVKTLLINQLEELKIDDGEQQ